MCDEAEGGCGGYAAVRREFPQSMSEFINRAANAPSGREKQRRCRADELRQTPLFLRACPKHPGQCAVLRNPGERYC